ncbi:MAG: glycosyltransferase [Nocardioides sp.]
MTTPPPQARVRRNEWGALAVPAVGAWTPTKAVTVVIPAYRAERTLPFVLAGLAAQTYPAHLLEVVVSDDSPEPMAALPEVRPERTRLVRTAVGWGRAAACHSGALAAEGEVVHWLDSDMLVERDHVEAQLRWHGLLDHAVVLGHKWFVDPAPLDGVDPAAVREAVADGRVADWFTGQEREGHTWVEELYERTDDLRNAGPRAHRAHVGATASLPRALYLESGGMDPALKLGEDSELGYRLAECGAVFVADHEARSWHLGPTHVMRRQDEVNDYNFPFLADRIPDGRVKRATTGRQYAVPYVEVVLDTTGTAHAEVVATVDAVLASTVPDLVVTLVGPWSRLTDERVAVLDDPLLDARLVHASYVSEPRVHLVERLAPGRCPAMLRLTLSSAAWAPTPKTLNRLVRELEWTHHGLRTALLPDGATARLERTAAVQRALRVAREGEDLDDVVDELFGSWWVDGAEVGFLPAGRVSVPRLPGRSGPARDPASLPETEGDGRPCATSPPTRRQFTADPAPVHRSLLGRASARVARLVRRSDA